MKRKVKYSQLLKCCTARVSSTRFFMVGLSKVNARNLFIFTEMFPCIKNKEHLIDSVIN